MSQVLIEVGKKAPQFTLPDETGVDVSLKEYAGSWVVLYFYPKDDTPGCTAEACEFTEGIQDFKNLDAAVLGCSPDSPADHRKYDHYERKRLRMLAEERQGIEEMIRRHSRQ